jgi:ABC-type Fe3+ transport system substrate-binding protein
MQGISRRGVLGAATVGAIATAVPLGVSAVTASANASAGPNLRPVPIETKSLSQLYNDAVAEGGQLVVYAGGDSANQNDGLAQAFAQQFPSVHITVKTDLSKYHDARIDNQLARGRLEPDVAQLQTLQDFDRWKSQGRLLAYKPAGWDAVYPQFKDSDGAYTGIMVLAFSYLSNNALVPAGQEPRTALDFLDPRYKGKLTITWPNDDDSVLYLFKNIIDRYGWGYLDKLLTQQPTFARGLPGSVIAVSTGQAAATISGFGALASNPTSPTTFAPATVDFFQSWAQTAAIFAAAKHPAAAKLYLNWLLSKPFQQSAVPQWSVREDVPPPAGYQPVLDYKNTNPVGFHEFMKDRAAVERFKSQIELYVGAPQGPDPAGAQGPLLLTTS